MRKLLIFLGLFLGLGLFGQGINVMHPVLRPATSGSVASYPSILDNTDSTAFWLIANSANWTDEGSGELSAWTDVTSNGYVFTSGTATNYPYGNADSVTFRGSNDYFADTFTFNQPCMIFMVVRATEYHDHAHFFDATTGVTRYRYDNNTEPQTYLYAGAELGPLNIPINELCIIRVVMNGASSSLQKNEDSAVTGDAGTNNPQGLTLAANAAKNAAWGFYSVREIIGLHYDPAASRELEIVNYLNTKYSVY